MGLLGLQSLNTISQGLFFKGYSFFGSKIVVTQSKYVYYTGITLIVVATTFTDITVWNQFVSHYLQICPETQAHTEKVNNFEEE